MIVAFLLGLAGSWHCMAMCGGFVWAFHRRRAPWAYQVGRLLGYLGLGALLGILGTGLLPWLGSKLVLGLAGVLLIGMALAQQFPSPPQAQNGFSLRAFLWSGLSPWLARPDWKGRFLLGLVTALFPCGLLSAAWVQAAAQASPWGAMQIMAAFWLGTAPALMIAPSLPRQWSQKVQKVAILLAAGWMLFQALAPESMGCIPTAHLHH